MKKDIFEKPIVEVIEFKMEIFLARSGGNNDLPEDEWD